MSTAMLAITLSLALSQPAPNATAEFTGVSVPGPKQFAPLPAIENEVILTDGAVLKQDINADRIVVPEGCVVHVEDDVRLFAEYALIIDGVVIVADRVEHESVAGYRLDLVAGAFLEVTGLVMGGSASHAPQDMKHLRVQGAQGSDIYLSAPVTIIDGQVIAGAGGRGGLHGKGGPGGDVVVHGNALTRSTEPDHPEAVGGVAGQPGLSVRPGLPGGNGGDGGGVVYFPQEASLLGPSERTELATMLSSAEWAHELRRTKNPTAVFELRFAQEPQCPGHGLSGLHGADGEGKSGSPGQFGTHGTMSNPAGSPGGIGGTGGSGAGGDGADGANGKACCQEEPEGQGGDGGQGGNGGDSEGGIGGKGGKGGNGYWDSNAGGYVGPGGDGGTGGNGGQAAPGDGGNSGQGGDGCLAGSGKQGGHPGNAPSTGAAGGTGGDPGNGVIPGNSGSVGAPGGHTGGSPGNPSSSGADCPQGCN